MSHGRNYRIERDQNIWKLSDCVVDAGTPVPPGPFCRDCAYYIPGALNANCRHNALRSVGYFQTPCADFTTRQEIEQNTNKSNTMEKETPKTKVCPKCGRELPAEAFGTHIRTKDGLQPTCKECRREAQLGRSRGGRPRKTPKPQEAAEQKQPEPATKKAWKIADGPYFEDLRNYTDINLVQELRRRGYDVTCKKTVEL
jgi:hypothetical protein